MNKVWQGNYEKHTTKNLFLKLLLKRFTYDIIKEIERFGPIKNLADAGCGEGFTTDRVKRALQHLNVDAYDIQPEYINYAKTHFPNISFNNLAFEKTKKRYDLVLCLEVLEHLPNPEKFLQVLADHTIKGVIVSVPREPLFRIANIFRGKYLLNTGNTPGHINHWTKSSFTKFLKACSKDVTVRTNSLWIIGVIKINGR